MPSYLQLQQASHALFRGEILAYPTEAVWGLGCDPWNSQAVAKVLRLKQRAWQKGVILIASDWAQLEPFCASLSQSQIQQMQSCWAQTGQATTWLVPSRLTTPWWLRGNHADIAVRVSQHPGVVALCEAFGGAVVSTSANPAGKPAAVTRFRCQQYFADAVNYLPGSVGLATKPSTIQSLTTGATLR